MTPALPPSGAATLRPLDLLLNDIARELQQGNVADAEHRLRTVLSEFPQAPAAHRMMATLAASTDRANLAITHMQAACELSPDSGVLRCEYGCLLAHLGQFQSALGQFQSAVALTPDRPESWYFLGITLMRSDRYGEALLPLRRALALAPQDFKSLLALARAEFEAGYPEDALPLWQRLLAIRPDDSDIVLKLGETLSRMGANDQACRLYSEALLRLPESADIWMASAQAQEDLGNREAAAHAYERALALRPGWAFPLSGLLGLQRGKSADARVNEAAELQSESTLPDTERALLGYEMGKVHDARGDYARAMASWHDANAARRRMIGELDVAAFLRKASDTVAAFNAECIAQWRGGSTDTRPVFVVGMPRSGTTLTEQIIAAHPLAFGCGELPDMALIAKNLAGPSDRAMVWPKSGLRLDGHEKQEAVSRYLRAATRHAPNSALRLVDKAPMNFHLLGLIAQLFPLARVIWCRRDPRDVAVSIYGENFSLSERFAASLSGIGHCINVQEELMRHWQSVLPLPILELDYQQLASSTATESRRLIEFVGLDWDPGCLDFHANERSVQTPSRWQVRQPVHTRSIGRWKNYAFALDPLLEVVASPP